MGREGKEVTEDVAPYGGAGRPDCSTCAYSEPLAERLRFRCRRHAPRPGAGNSEAIVWPVVSWDDWCGEHLRRELMRESADPFDSFTRGDTSR